MEYVIDLSTPIMTEPATVLAELTFFTEGVNNVCIYLTGVSSPAVPGGGPAIWPTPATPVEVEVTQMYVNGVTAVLSDLVPVIGDPHPCENVVGTREVEWSYMKALYR